MDNNKESQLLPIGSVVLLKNANKELMITSYYMTALPENKETEEFNESMVYDYGGCRYPEGIMTSNSIILFNHNQIDKVLYEGLKTEELENNLKDMQERKKEFFQVLNGPSIEKSSSSL